MSCWTSNEFFFLQNHNWLTFFLPTNLHTFFPIWLLYALLICGYLHETNGRAWFLFQPPLAKMTENLFDSRSHSSFEDAYVKHRQITPVDGAYKFRCCDALLYVCLYICRSIFQLGPCTIHFSRLRLFHEFWFIYVCVLAANKYLIMSAMSIQRSFS